MQIKKNFGMRHTFLVAYLVFQIFFFTGCQLEDSPEHKMTETATPESSTSQSLPPASSKQVDRDDEGTSSFCSEVENKTSSYPEGVNENITVEPPVSLENTEKNRTWDEVVKNEQALEKYLRENLSKESYGYYYAHDKNLDLILEISIVHSYEAYVDTVLSSYEGEHWDVLIKKEASFSKKELEEYADSINNFCLINNISFNAFVLDVTEKICIEEVIIPGSGKIPEEELPKAIEGHMANRNLPKDVFFFVPGVYRPPTLPGENPDT